MIFNSFDFLIFYAVVFVLYFSVPQTYRWVLLLISSYFFYMYWEASYIFLIIFSTILDYLISRYLLAGDQAYYTRRVGVILSVSMNLGLLATFKYLDFIRAFLADALGSVGVLYEPNQLSILLPVGISFYTFQTMSYTIDVYRGKLKPELHLGKFALYVSFFPQLVAGPIERATHLLPQFKSINAKFDFNRTVSGLLQVLWGLFKKVVVADTLAIHVNAVFGTYEMQSGASLLLAVYFFAIQIYCDFSGYSDIAIGISRVLGFDLMENFKTPYFSKGITEFWRRWHISLSSWLRDYLYIPLGGNRKGKIRTYLNLMITMLLGGLWHGASWNFVIWGGLNGLFLSVEKYFKGSTTTFSPLLKPIRILVTFHLICLTWVFFRASDFREAIHILEAIIRMNGKLAIRDSSVLANGFFGITILFLVDWIMRYKNISFVNLTKLSIAKSAVACSVLILLLVLFGVSEGSQFIYFQF